MTLLHRTRQAVAASRQVARFVWGMQRRLLILLCLVTISVGVLPALLAWMTRLLIDAIVSDDGPVAQIMGIAFAIGAIALVSQLLSVVDGFMSGEMERRLRVEVDDAFARKLNSLDGLHPFEAPAVRDRMLVAQQGGEMGPGQLVPSGAALLQQGVTGVSLWTALLAVDRTLALLTALAAIPAVMAETHLAHRRLQLALTISPLDRRRIFFGLLLTDLRAVKEIRLFGMGDYLRARMRTEYELLTAEKRRVEVHAARVQAALGALAGLVALVAVMVLAMRASDGMLTAGDAVLALAAVTGVAVAGTGAARTWSHLSGGALLFEQFLTFLETDLDDLPRRGFDVPARVHRGHTPPGFVLEDVWFRYSAGHPWVLKGVDLHIPPGRVLAVVGLNGAGKTTLVKLLCRFYDPDRGRILLDGVDVATMDPLALRSRITPVFQDYMEYDLTAAENIGLGDVQHMGDLRAVRRAAEAAGVDAVLRSLPLGYDTMLSRLFAADGGPDNGTSLSGGEWQKVALARSLVDLREIVLFDEPTASMDAEAEYQLYQRLHSLLEDRTAVLISHRFSTTRLAHAVAVLEDGRVVEKGTHAELLGRGGAYARLFNRQADAYLQSDTASVRSGDPVCHNHPVGREVTGP